jgi:hypothetical protein
VKAIEFFGLYQRIMPDAKGRTEYHYLLADYICKVTGGDLRASSDVSRVEWVPRAKLKEYTMTEGTLAVIEEAFDRKAQDSALRKRT